MSPIANTHHANESPSEEHDVESVSVPLLSEAQTPSRFAFLFKVFALIWDSCLGCAFCGSVFLTAAVVAMTKLDKDDVSVFQSTFSRGLISSIVFVPLGYFRTGYVIGPLDSNMKWILLRGTCASCGFLFALLAIILVSLSEGALLNDTYPAILALMSWALRIESIDVLSWVGILGAIVSNMLIARPPFLFGGEESIEWDTSRSIGLLCSFLCSFSLASGFLIVGKIDKKVPSIVIANHAAVQIMIISIPFLAAGFPEKIEWRPSAEHIGLYFILACGTLNQIFIVRSFQIGPPVKAAMCSLVRVPLTVSSGVIFFSEKISILHAVGGVLLISSIALVIWRRDVAKKRNAQELLANENLSDCST